MIPKLNYFIVLVILNVIQYNLACDRSTKICEKYCEIERHSCNGLKHPLCSKFDSSDSELSSKENFINLTSSVEREEIIFEINRFRNNLAFGHVTNHSKATNLQGVNWSYDLQHILETKLQYQNVCLKISLNDAETLESITFIVHKKGQFYELTELIDIMKVSYHKIKWEPLIRANFNKIGCAITEKSGKYTLHCLTKKTNSINYTFDPAKARNIGNHCKSCKCNKVWEGLCDNDDFRMETSDYNQSSLYITIGLVVLLIIAMSVCLFWIGMKCVSNCQKGSYKLNHENSSAIPPASMSEAFA